MFPIRCGTFESQYSSKPVSLQKGAFAIYAPAFRAAKTISFFKGIGLAEISGAIVALASFASFCGLRHWRAVVYDDVATFSVETTAS